MFKNKKNGFFLSETIVIIAIVSVVLLGTFKLFSSVYSKYKEGENYNKISAINAASSLKQYYSNKGFDYSTLLNGGYYVDLTNSVDYESLYYDKLKEQLYVSKVYLIDLTKVYDGTNINVFDVSLRKYLKTLKNSESTIVILAVVNVSEYASVSVTPSIPTLIGNPDDEYLVLVVLNETFTDPGYIDWDGVAPTTSWEPELDTTKVGKYYLNYNFDGYLLRRRVDVIKNEYTYNYVGTIQTFTASVAGYYNVELWGAQGGAGSTYTSGLAPKTSGKIYLSKNQQLYFYVGGAGISNCTSNLCLGGYNGGGKGGGDATVTIYQGSGGGATDVRYGGTSLNDRIMVAAGSGGGSLYNPYWWGNGGSGGTLYGSNASYGGPSGNAVYPGFGGTQIAGGVGGNCVAGTFGNGGTRDVSVAGGGGGYYGGGCGWGAGGGGGSSFISGYAGVNAITSAASTVATNNTKHYSNKYFIDGEIQYGVNTGYGKATITYISSTEPTRTNTKLNNVRYVKDCINGNSSTDQIPSWVELQAIYQGSNVAKGKTVTGTVAQNASYPYSRITDGDITTSNWSYASVSGLQCVTVDLTQTYNLDEIGIWHYFGDGRTYYSNTTYVSSDNTTWTSVIANSNAETSTGKRVNAWD